MTNDRLPSLPPEQDPRALVEALGEEAMLDFLGVGTERKDHVRFTPDRQLVYLRHLIRSGRRGESALVAGVSYETMRRLRVNSKEFAAAEEAAWELHRDLVRALILDRAEHGSVEETHEAALVHQAKVLKMQGDSPENIKLTEEGGGFSREMILTKTVRKKSDAMLLSYAKSIMPEYREKGDVIANNASGGVLVVNAPGSNSEDWEKQFGADQAVDAEAEVVEDPPEPPPAS